MNTPQIDLNLTKKPWPWQRNMVYRAIRVLNAIAVPSERETPSPAFLKFFFFIEQERKDLNKT